jgi:polygalacturonase
MKTTLFLFLSFLAVLAPKPALLQTDASGIFNVKAFGATGDGKSLDSPAVNKAIEAAAAAGGGTVRFPAGSYLCLSIRLKGNISLYLDLGATIVADAAGYDLPEPNQWDAYQDFGHSHWHNSLIWGEGIENVSILGPGMIWGKGVARANQVSQAAAISRSALNFAAMWSYAMYRSCTEATLRFSPPESTTLPLIT